MIDPAEHIGLAKWYARKFTRVYRHIPMEEAYGSACVGLVIAAARFDPTLGEFPAYATWWMRRWCQTLRHRAEPIPAVRDSLEQIARPDHAPETDALLDVKAEVSRLLSRLTERQREVIRRRFGIGCREHTLLEAGRAVGVSHQRARQIEQIAIERMRYAESVA